MNRRLLASLAMAVVVVGSTTAALTSTPQAAAIPVALVRTNNAGANPVTYQPIAGTPCWRQSSNQIIRPADVAFSACVAPTTTSTSSTSSTSTSLAPTTTAIAAGSWLETFDNNTGQDRFNLGVWHRDPYVITQTQWSADHDLMCANPATQRVVHRNLPAESFYTCVNHLMSSVGDTSGYSIAWFSPKQTFADVDAVRFSVNLTDLGTRQWWKVGVVSESLYNSTYNDSCCGPAPGFLASDVEAADLPMSLQTSQLFYASWGGGLSGGYPAGMKIGDTSTFVVSNPSPTDKATRHPVSIVDNQNGTVTFTVAGVAVTRPGSFPACPCRVVITSHAYTPTKQDPASYGFPIGFTWHWDDVNVTE